MANLSAIVKQLKKERRKQLSRLDAVIRGFSSVYGRAKPSPKRRKMSAKGRAKIAAAQRARWAKIKARKK